MLQIICCPHAGSLGVGGDKPSKVAAMLYLSRMPLMLHDKQGAPRCKVLHTSTRQSLLVLPNISQATNHAHVEHPHAQLLKWHLRRCQEA